MPETAERPPFDVEHPNTLHVRYATNPDGWVTAQIVELPAVISQGRNADEAFRNLLDAAHDLTHAATGAERLAATVQARLIEPLFALLRR